MRPQARRAGGMISQCACGRAMPLPREYLDNPGKLIACPRCGYEARVWQWAAKENRREAAK